MHTIAVPLSSSWHASGSNVRAAVAASTSAMREQALPVGGGFDAGAGASATLRALEEPERGEDDGHHHAGDERAGENGRPVVGGGGGGERDERLAAVVADHRLEETPAGEGDEDAGNANVGVGGGLGHGEEGAGDVVEDDGGDRAGVLGVADLERGGEEGGRVRDGGDVVHLSAVVVVVVAREKTGVLARGGRALVTKAQFSEGSLRCMRAIQGPSPVLVSFSHPVTGEATRSMPVTPPEGTRGPNTASASTTSGYGDF